MPNTVMMAAMPNDDEDVDDDNDAFDGDDNGEDDAHGHG